MPRAGKTKKRTPKAEKKPAEKRLSKKVAEIAPSPSSIGRPIEQYGQSAGPTLPRRIIPEVSAIVVGVVFCAVGLLKLWSLLGGDQDLKVTFPLRACHGANVFYPQWAITADGDAFLHMQFANCAEATVVSSTAPTSYRVLNDHDSKIDIDTSGGRWSAKMETFNVIEKQLDIILRFHQPFGPGATNKSLRFYGNGSAQQVDPALGMRTTPKFIPSLWVDAHHTVSNLTPPPIDVAVVSFQDDFSDLPATPDGNHATDQGFRYQVTSEHYGTDYVLAFDFNSGSRRDRDFLLAIWTAIFSLGMGLTLEACFSLLRP